MPRVMENIDSMEDKIETFANFNFYNFLLHNKKTSDIFISVL